MTRHGRNATNSAVYTYHERQKDASSSGYGTDKCRLGKDSLKGKMGMLQIIDLPEHYIIEAKNLDLPYTRR